MDTTGNLTNVKKNAPFPFGVAMLPAHNGRGSPTGGGNFYLFKKMTDEQRSAALKFVKWITEPSAPPTGVSKPATSPSGQTLGKLQR